MKELFPQARTLVAEYEDFQTPICDYVNVYKDADPVIEAEEEMWELLSDMKKFVCNSTANLQTVEVVAEKEVLDFFWPRLTGKIRVK